MQFELRHDALTNCLSYNHSRCYMPPILIAMLFVVSFAVLAANVIATMRILRSDFGSKAQKSAQLAIVWCVPVVGAAVLIFLTRSCLEPSTGLYPRENEELEDAAVAQPDYSSSD